DFAGKSPFGSLQRTGGFVLPFSFLYLGGRKTGVLADRYLLSALDFCDGIFEEISELKKNLEKDLERNAGGPLCPLPGRLRMERLQRLKDYLPGRGTGGWNCLRRSRGMLSDRRGKHQPVYGWNLSDSSFYQEQGDLENSGSLCHPHG